MQRLLAPVAASLVLLLSGCTFEFAGGTDDIELQELSQQVRFTVTVDGPATVRYTDGINPVQTVQVRRGTREWLAETDMYRYLAAMTVTPADGTSKVTCSVGTSDEAGQWEAEPLTHTSKGPGKAAVCIRNGEAPDTQPDNAASVTVLGDSVDGGGQFRVQSPAGGVYVDNLNGMEQRELTFNGTVQAVVIRGKGDGTVRCTVHTGGLMAEHQTDLAHDEQAGLGAIAQCVATVNGR